MVHIAESTVGRRYAGWFIKNAERTQKILDDIKSMPLPVAPKPTGPTTAASTQDTSAQNRPTRNAAQKVAWGGVKVA
jgi:translation initiation factor 3 subunit L